jgi:hypothetical protein
MRSLFVRMGTRQEYLVIWGGLELLESYRSGLRLLLRRYYKKIVVIAPQALSLRAFLALAECGQAVD